MHLSTYRLKSPIGAVIEDDAVAKVNVADVVGMVTELPSGSEFVVADAKPDHKGMVSGTCEGKSVLVFQRDLDERAEAIGTSRRV